MKRSLLICIIIAGIVFSSGCTGQEKLTDYKTSTYTPTITPIQTVTLTSTPIPIKTDPGHSGSTITNSIDMEFILIPAGEFDMGSNNYRGEDPVHHVKISNAFYMGKYEVTQKQWRDMMQTQEPQHTMLVRKSPIFGVYTI